MRNCIKRAAALGRFRNTDLQETIKKTLKAIRRDNDFINRTPISWEMIEARQRQFHYKALYNKINSQTSEKSWRTPLVTSHPIRSCGAQTSQTDLQHNSCS